MPFGECFTTYIQGIILMNRLKVLTPKVCFSSVRDMKTNSMQVMISSYSDTHGYMLSRICSEWKI